MAQVGSNTLGVANVEDVDTRDVEGGRGDLQEHGQGLANAAGAAEDGHLVGAGRGGEGADTRDGGSAG